MAEAETYQTIEPEQVRRADEAEWRMSGRSFRMTWRRDPPLVLVAVEVQHAPDGEWLPMPVHTTNEDT